MKIEAIDLFYYALPQIKDEADGSQDSFVARIRSNTASMTSRVDFHSPIPSVATSPMASAVEMTFFSSVEASSNTTLMVFPPIKAKIAWACGALRLTGAPSGNAA
jgi:hypothetical protein